MAVEVPQVSVVLATRDRPQRLAALLKSLRDQRLPREHYEVIAVDDGSGPENRRVLADELRRGTMDLRVIWNERSSGPAAARNAGWRAARAPLVAFTDDDCVVTEGWLGAGLEAFGPHPDAILQGPVMPIPEEYTGLSFFHYTIETQPVGPWYETANIFYPRTLLERYNGFSEAFTGPGGEDTDLAWRALADGTRAVLVEDALVHHAVTYLGPVGMLRRANRWTETMRLFKDHPSQRGALVHGLFWEKAHYQLLRAALGLVLPPRWWTLRMWLAAPYMARLTDRRSGGLLAPYILVYDLIEMQSVVRGALRYRTLVL